MWKYEVKKFQNELMEFGTTSKKPGSAATFGNSENMNICSDMIAKVKDGWLLAKAVRNVILVLMAVLEFRKTFKN